jgi:hypothetical protein
MTAVQGAGVPVGVRTRLDDTVYATKVYAYEPVISSSLVFLTELRCSSTTFNRRRMMLRPRLNSGVE